jgi:PAS domain S-box-containing protein
MDLPFDNASNRLQISYQLVFERNPLPMLVYDKSTQRVLAANEAAVKCYGHSAAEFHGLQLADLHHPDERPLLKLYLQQPEAERETRRAWRHQSRNGDLLHVEVDAQDVEMDGVRARMLLVRDVTQLRLVEQRAMAEREILSAVVKASHDAIISTDVEGRILTFSPGAERVFGVSRERMEGQGVESLLPERFRAAHVQQRRHFAEAKGPSRMMGLRMVKGLRADGKELDLEGTIAQISVGQEQVLITTLQDVTARVQGELERQESRAQLSDLANKLMSQEKELVKRIAQAMHDQLGQTMAAIRMVHETMGVLQPDRVSPEIARLDQQLGALIKQAIRQVRQVLIELHPPLLDEHGLAAALDNELRNRSLTQTRTHLALEVPPALAAVRWPTAVEYAAFMVAREAVENALRHSGASSISVHLSGGPLSLEVVVLDNGAGFAPEKRKKLGHLGIAGMGERAKSVGASLDLEPRDGGGTCVSLRWQPAT